LIAPVTRACFHPDGSIIGAALDNGRFSITDTRNQQVIQAYDAHSGPITSIQIHPTGSFALTTSTDRKICIWDLIEGQLFFRIGAHNASISDGRWNRDGSQFLTCDRNGILLQWQTNFDKLIKNLECEADSGRLAGDQVEKRLREAMDVLPPPPRSRVPEPTDPQTKVEAPPGDVVEAALHRMLNQLDMLSKTMSMMDRRASMLEEKLASLQKAQVAERRKEK
jgi:WD40 repeat protein